MNPTAAVSVFRTEHPEIDRFFDIEVELFKTQLEQLDREIDPHRVPRANDSFHRRTLKAFQDSQEACYHLETACPDRAAVQAAQEQFRLVTDPWFCRSWIAHRARTKPAGFVGDYEMLRKLYAEATPARGLGGYLDLCILDLPLARAVRARLAAVREFLIGELAGRKAATRVLDIACGPCQEYLDWPELGDDRSIKIVAMDSDPQALVYLEQTFAEPINASTRLQAVRYNALRTRSASTTVRKFGKFDILYSVGLCDYLSDQHLIALLAAWRDSLNDGGVMFVAFKDSDRYDKTPYQWHLDWYFYQRTREEILFLFEQAGFDIEAMETRRDDTGIIINLIDRRRHSSRFDRAHSRRSRRQHVVADSPTHHSQNKSSAPSLEA